MSQCACYVVRGGALGVHQDRTTCPRHWGVMLHVREGSEKEQWHLLHSAGFQSLPLIPTSKVGPSGADSWACVCSRTLWVSPANSPVRLGVSPTAASTPTGVFNRWFEALFPLTGALGCVVCLTSQLCLPVYLHVNVGPPTPPAAASPGLPATAFPTPVLQLPPCHKSSPPSCPSLPLLPVWMNVSSLTPWLSDFHTVQFSDSSGCFLFLNCCPSFGCVRRHTVSTYTSMLARSLWSLLNTTITTLVC